MIINDNIVLKREFLEKKDPDLHSQILNEDRDQL